MNWSFVDLRKTSYKHGLMLSSSIVLAAPALDLDFLLNIIHEKRPLDWEAVLKSDVPLKVVASCLDTLQPVILEDFTGAQDLETCLRASANVPEVSPKSLGRQSCIHLHAESIKIRQYLFSHCAAAIAVICKMLSSLTVSVVRPTWV